MTKSSAQGVDLSKEPNLDKFATFSSKDTAKLEIREVYLQHFFHTPLSRDLEYKNDLCDCDCITIGISPCHI